jgi:hypothetical protein
MQMRKRTDGDNTAQPPAPPPAAPLGVDQAELGTPRVLVIDGRRRERERERECVCVCVRECARAREVRPPAAPLGVDLAELGAKFWE